MLQNQAEKNYIYLLKRTLKIFYFEDISVYYNIIVSYFIFPRHVGISAVSKNVFK